VGSFTPCRVTDRFIFVSERMTHPTHGLPHPTQGHTSFHIRLREELHTHLMGFLTPHRGTQHSIFVSERKNTPISWAHPTHGLSHRSTHSICVLEDVTRNCNHQHSLLARDAFSIRPSLARKYSNFVLAVVINNIQHVGLQPHRIPS
jgi:hypothetical protein